MNELRRAWGPSAVTQWSVITGVLVMVVLAVPSGSSTAGASAAGFTLSTRVVTALGAAMVASLVLVVAAATWLRPGRDGHRWARALITFAVAGAAAGASRAWLIDVLGADDPVGTAWRVVSNTIAAVIWLGLTAIVVDHVREHRATMTELRLRQTELEDLDRREREELDALAIRLRDELLAPARAALARIRAALVSVEAGGRATEEAARIEDAVATSIRPLSHEILMAEPVVQATAPGAPVPDRAARLVARASHSVVRSPWIVTLVPVVLSPLLLGPTWGIAFLLVNALITWPLYALLLMGLRAVLEPRLQRMPTWAAATALVAGYAIITAGVVGVTSALGFLSPREVPYMWVGIITLTAILVAATVLEAAAELADEDERALREVLTRIAIPLARIQQRLRHEHQVLGSLLHGPVQGALLGVAASLEQAPADMPEAERQALVADALERMGEVERRLEAPADDGQSLDDALDGVLMLWARVLDVRVSVADDVRVALGGAPAARGAVADVVAEALTNAFRHGAARAAWLEMSLDGTVVVLEVVDDGVLGAAGGPGMGSRLYDESSHEWSLARGDDGLTHLRVVVPVAGMRSGPAGAAVAAGAPGA